MGYNKERFISEIDERLICGICNKVFENPKLLLSCRHIFCFDCIEESVLNKNHCPLDQKHIDWSQIRDAPDFILEHIGSLKMKCDFAEFGCKDVMSLNVLKLHRLNCEFHPKRKVECEKCGLEIEKRFYDAHNCVQMLKMSIESQNQKLEEMKRKHSREMSSIKSQLQRMHWDLEQFRLYATPSLGPEAFSPQKHMISFSCINDSQTGTHEIIFIQTINNTFKCEANLLTKIAQIKYYASSLANLNTNEFTLFSNGVQLEDHNYMSYYNIKGGTICHLLPNHIYITFDCVDIRIILGMSVRTSDTIKTIIEQLRNQIQKLIPEQLYLYLKHCDCSLFFNDIKLEESYQLSNYDVLMMHTLKYCNRIGI